MPLIALISTFCALLQQIIFDIIDQAANYELHHKPFQYLSFLTLFNASAVVGVVTNECYVHIFNPPRHPVCLFAGQYLAGHVAAMLYTLHLGC